MDIEIGIPALVLSSLVMFVAMTAQSTLGIGGALIAAPTLALMYPEFLPAPLIINGAVITLAVLIRERKHIDWSRMNLILLGGFVGICIAGLAFGRMSTDAYAILIGILVVAGTAMSMRGWSIPISAKSSLGAGTLCGFMHATVSLPGPPIMLLYQNEPAKVFRPTLAAYFFVTSLMSLAMLFFVGRLGTHEVQMGLAILPGSILGFAMSSAFVGRLQNRSLRSFVLLFAAASGCVLILKGLTS